MAQGPQPPQYMALVAEVSGSDANSFCSTALQCGAQRVPKLRELHMEPREMPGSHSSHKLSGPGRARSNGGQAPTQIEEAPGECW